MGVSQKLLCVWKKKFARTAGSSSDERDAEIRRLKRERSRVAGERDILMARLRSQDLPLPAAQPGPATPATPALKPRPIMH
jgi:hypothetical protein